MNKELGPLAIASFIGENGECKEVTLSGEKCLCGRRGLIEITFFRFPTQDELYALLSCAAEHTKDVKWRFEGWKGWNKDNIDVLMRAYK